MFTSVWAGGSNLWTTGHRTVKFCLEIDDSHCTLFVKYCFYIDNYKNITCVRLWGYVWQIVPTQPHPSAVPTQPHLSAVPTQPHPSAVPTQTHPSAVPTQPHPSAVPTFHYSQLVLAPFQGPCYVIPPLSTFLSFLSLYLYLVPPPLIPYQMPGGAHAAVVSSPPHHPQPPLALLMFCTVISINSCMVTGWCVPTATVKLWPWGWLSL